MASLLVRYRRDWLRWDLLAGLTTAAPASSTRCWASRSRATTSSPRCGRPWASWATPTWPRSPSASGGWPPCWPCTAGPPKVPGPLVVVVLGIALVAATSLEGRGVALVGPVNGGLPTFQLADLDGVGRLLPAAAGSALVSSIESISAARAFAARTDPPVDADRELLALGAANLAGGLFQAYPAGGGTSQTAINDGAGARTQVAELVTAAMAVLTLTLLASLLADLAQPILGAIVLVAAIGLVNLAPLRRIRSVRQRDFWLGLVAMAGVLTFGVLRGVLMAVLISLLVQLHELDHPRIVAVQSVPGLLVVRPEGFF